MVYMKKGGCVRLCDAETAEKLKGQGYTPFEVKAPQMGEKAAQNESKSEKPKSKK